MTRILSTGHVGLDCVKLSDGLAYRDSATAREENERLKAEFAAMVAAAPVRQVVATRRGAHGFILTLECGHEAGYTWVRSTLRCHECRKANEAATASCEANE